MNLWVQAPIGVESFKKKWSKVIGSHEKITQVNSNLHHPTVFILLYSPSLLLMEVFSTVCRFYSKLFFVTFWLLALFPSMDILPPNYKQSMYLHLKLPLALKWEVVINLDYKQSHYKPFSGSHVHGLKSRFALFSFVHTMPSGMSSSFLSHLLQCSHFKPS